MFRLTKISSKGLPVPDDSTDYWVVGQGLQVRELERVSVAVRVAGIIVIQFHEIKSTNNFREDFTLLPREKIALTAFVSLCYT